MEKKIVINPVTRISGFLEIQVIVENNVITSAKSDGMMFRGFEKMLRGRSPLDSIYFTQRICGICSTAHGMASALALENALSVIPDKNEAILRDILHGCEFLQNHIRHFYQFTLPDFIKDIGVSPVYDVGHNDFRIPKEINDKIASHYATSIEYGRDAHEMLAVLGGKAPHNHGIAMGGVNCDIDSYKIAKLKSLLDKIQDFVKNVMLEDINIIASYYKDYFKNGIGYGNFMSYGLYDDQYVKPSVLINGTKKGFDSQYINESIYSSWYSSPYEGDPDKQSAYSWIKAPRYQENAVEVGPLARMILSGEYNNGVSTMDRTIARVLETEKVCEILQNKLNQVELKPPTPKKREVPNGTFVGKGLIDTLRGSLGHWIKIENQKISNYDIIAPSTWNLSPKDQKGNYGVVEKALIGTHINNIQSPVEIGRIVRSYDPCISCATHMYSGDYSVEKILI